MENQVIQKTIGGLVITHCDSTILNVESTDERENSKLENSQKIIEIEKYLKQREPIFHNRMITPTIEDVKNQIDVDFWEVGASGNIYSKDYVIENLEKRYSNNEIDDIEKENWKIDNFQVKEISTNSYLVTYTLCQPNRITQRVTIWKGSIQSGFKILYHQGTISKEGDTYGKNNIR